eukprot:3319680-Prymnesium_polylepis.1
MCIRDRRREGQKEGRIPEDKGGPGGRSAKWRHGHAVGWRSPEAPHRNRTGSRAGWRWKASHPARTRARRMRQRQAAQSPRQRTPRGRYARSCEARGMERVA